MELVKPNNGVPAQFHVTGPYRHSDGAYKFQITVMVPSPVIGGVTDVVGFADVHIKNAKVAMALGEALRQIADQLPADLVA